jgi:long-chain acyl-CoA synthetase
MSMSKPYLTQALHAARRQHPQRIATVFNGRRTDYQTLASRVSCAATGLRERGVKAGDRVGILALNSDRYLEVYFAIWWSGGVVNPVNVRWSAHEIAYSLDDCGTSMLLVDDELRGAGAGAGAAVQMPEDHRLRRRRAQRRPACTATSS